MEPQQEIKATAQVYFAGLHESNPAKIREAFHPEAKITGYLPDELAELTVDNLADTVAKQHPSDQEQGLAQRAEIVSIHVAGKTGLVIARTHFMGMTFLDTLSFLQVQGTWLIYNKLFHIEA